MATGDLLTALVDIDGRALHLKIEGLSAGGTYLFGASNPAVYAERAAGTVKIKLNVSSAGYDNAASLGTVARTVYGVIDQRLPDGTDANAWQITSGTMVGTMVHGETATQAGTGATGTVITNCPCPPVLLNTISGTPNNSGVWTGGTSGATFTPTVVPANYSGIAVKREGVDGSDLWICVALDEYLYSDDTATLDALSAIYTNGTASASATAMAVTNASESLYTKPICRWLSVPYERITSPTFTIRAGVYHRFAKQGKPVACVQFEVTDGSTTNTVTATRMTASGELPASGLHTAWYEATFTAANFTDNAVLTCNVRAYPWIGDATAVVDSSTVASPSKSLCDLKLFNDHDNDFGTTIAYVDQTSLINTTSDLTGLIEGETLTQGTTGATAIFNYSIAGSPNVVRVSVVSGSPDNSHDWTGGTSSVVFTPSTLPTAVGSDSNAAYDIANDATAQANPSATIGGATVAIRAFNNSNHSRNNCDGGIVYLTKGLHPVTGAITATTSNTYLTITRAAGVADGEAKLQKKNNSLPVRLILTHVKLYDLDVVPRTTDTSGAAAISFYGSSSSTDFLWIDSCRVNNATANPDSTWAVFAGYEYQWHTHNTLSNQNKLIESGEPTILALDNYSSTARNFLSTICCVGNYYTAAGNVITDTALDNCYFANNYSEAATGALVTRQTTFSHGIAIIGNVVESLSVGVTAMLLMAESASGDGNNLCLVHNTTAGQRVNWAYNTSTSAGYRRNFHGKYNAVQWLPTKSASNNGQIYVKNTPVFYGAGHAGNHSESQGTPLVDKPIWPGWNFSNNASAGWVDDQSGSGNPGGGDYHPTEGSVVLNKVQAGEAVWPYDLDGNVIPDDGRGTAGAFQFPIEDDQTTMMLMGVG